MNNTHGGVLFILSALRFSNAPTPKIIDFFDFPPSSPSFREGRGGRGVEVSDPPFFVPRTSRSGRPFFTPFFNGVTVGGVAHFSVTTPIFIPAGRLR